MRKQIFAEKCGENIIFVRWQLLLLGSHVPLLVCCHKFLFIYVSVDAQLNFVLFSSHSNKSEICSTPFVCIVTIHSGTIKWYNQCDRS